MKTRAAVAWEAGKPLTIETVDLEGPKAGEVLVEVKATGICHTDWFTLSGDDPEGLFPAILGHEGAGIVREVGAGVSSLAVGDHVIPLYTPECRQCKFCLSRKTNLCQKIRATQGKGLMPDGTSRFSIGGKPVLHYMGTSTFANTSSCRKSRWRRSVPTRPSTWSATSAAASPPASARCSSPPVEAGANVVFGLGGIGLNVIQGAEAGRRRQDHRHRPQPAASDARSG
jgi:S-(hydroxymethyl)glutathione dehydrogenase/alcohol dehydrogenase